MGRADEVMLRCTASVLCMVLYYVICTYMYHILWDVVYTCMYVQYSSKKQMVISFTFFSVNR